MFHNGIEYGEQQILKENQKQNLEDMVEEATVLTSRDFLMSSLDNYRVM